MTLVLITATIGIWVMVGVLLWTLPPQSLLKRWRVRRNYNKLREAMEYSRNKVEAFERWR